MLDINNTETLEIYVLGDDFKFYQNLKYLPLTSYPSNIQSALIVYSLRGKAKLTVHEDVHWIQPKELIILLPGQFVSFSDPSEDFLTVTMVISSSLFSDALSGAPRFSPHFFFYMRNHYWYSQTELRGEKRSVSICGQPEKAWLLWFSKCYGRVGESTLEKRSVYIALHWAYNWALFERRSNEMLYIEGRIGEKLDIVQSIYSSICFWLALMYKGRQKDRFVQIE